MIRFLANPNSGDSSPPTGVRRFFFAEEVPYGMALARIALTFVLLCDMGYRWGYSRELYSTDGAPSPLAACYGFHNFLPEFPASVIVPLHTGLIFLLFCGCIGWCTRFSLSVATLLYFYFGMVDSLSTVNKYAVIATHGMFLLSLSEAGTVWSVDAWLKKRAERNRGANLPLRYWQPTPVWPQRLMQIMVGMVYLGAAMTKMHTPAYFSGDQMLYWMLTNVTADHPIGKALSQYPGLAVVSAYAAILWEVTFLFCSWRGWGRVLMVSMGVFFHLSTFFVLGLTVFPMVMFSIYLAFLHESDVQWVAYHYRRLRRRILGRKRLGELLANAFKLPAWQLPSVSPYRSAAAFCLTLGVIMFVGTEIEYRGDYYGERRPEGPHTLRELSEEEVQTMLGPEAPLREEDKFLAFDIGNMFLGGRLVNQLNQFRQGERLFCEVSMNPPHEDMWVEINLHDTSNRLVSRIGQVVSREMFRAHWNYLLNEAFEPGEYTLVLRSREKEIMRRHFTLNSAVRAPVAN